MAAAASAGAGDRTVKHPALGPVEVSVAVEGHGAQDVRGDGDQVACIGLGVPARDVLQQRPRLLVIVVDGGVADASESVGQGTGVDGTLVARPALGCCGDDGPLGLAGDAGDPVGAADARSVRCLAAIGRRRPGWPVLPRVSASPRRHLDGDGYRDACLVARLDSVSVEQEQHEGAVADQVHAPGRVAVAAAARRTEQNEDVVQQRHRRTTAQRVGEQRRDLRPLQRRALLWRMCRDQAKHRLADRSAVGAPREVVDGECVCADVRALGGIGARDLLIERLSTGLVHRGRARSRARAELGKERAGMIDPERGVDEPTGIRRPEGLHAGLKLRHRAPVQQPAHLAIGGRHQGRGELPAPRSRPPCQPAGERRTARDRVGTSLVEHVPCPTLLQRSRPARSHARRTARRSPRAHASSAQRTRPRGPSDIRWRVRSGAGCPSTSRRPDCGCRRRPGPTRLPQHHRSRPQP